MKNIFAILFALVDSKYWDSRQLVAWTDKLILESESPKEWLLDLSVCNTVHDALNVIQRAMKQFGVLLPEDIGDLMSGLVLLHFDKGEVSIDDARSQIVDIADSYGVTDLDAEASGSIDLNNVICMRYRDRAKKCLSYISKVKPVEV